MGATAMMVAASTVPSALGDDRKTKSQVQPVYSELARKMNVKGTVKVEVVITPAGTVKSAKALGGHPLLIESALDAVKKWKYEPSATETTQVVNFDFKGTQ